MSELTDRVQKTDKILRFLGVATSVVVLIFAILTFINTLRVNENLQTQVEDHRQQTENTIDSIKSENEKSHDELYRFVTCILLIPPGERTEAQIESCVQKAKEVDLNSSSSNNTLND